MTHTFTYEINETQSKACIRDFLRERGYSRQVLIDLKKKESSVLLNQNAAFLNEILEAGNVLTVTLEEETSSANIVPVPLPLSILYEDEHIMVLNKAADMPVHPSQGNYENTVANGLAYYFQQRGESFVFRCINRLDRDTTGLFLIAKHKLSGCILSQQMKERKIRRTYLAIVKGCPPPSGTIDAPIGRKEGSTIERCIDEAAGESAVTHYKLAAQNDDYSLISLRLETGRTHQIRVHMKHIGYPLIGDYLYNPECTLIGRQALHSHQLEFQHPITHETMRFSAPLPEDMNFI